MVTRKPSVAHAGTRSRRSKAVSRPRMVSVEGLYRLTYRAVLSEAAKYTESWYLVALSMPVPSQQVVPASSPSDS